MDTHRLMREPYHITSPWGPRVHPITKKKSFHNGVDLRAKEFTPLHCPEKGTLVKSWHDNLNGHAARIKHKDKITAYAHLSSVIAPLGMELQAGDVFAYTGNTGMSTAPHLHFGIHVKDTKNNWKWIDPTDYVRMIYTKDYAINYAIPIAIVGALGLLTASFLVGRYT